MAERYETGTSERRRFATSGKQSPRPTSQRATSDQRTRTIDREELRRRSRYSSDEEYERARRRRIAERRRRKKEENKHHLRRDSDRCALGGDLLRSVLLFTEK